MERIALFGDVQGHHARFAEALQALDVDVDRGIVPEGLTVVQVGDLIHKGPDSDGVIAMVDRFLRCSPDRWIQLIGNHEGQYLGGPIFWPAEISDDAGRTLAQWFIDGASRIAVGLDTVEHGPVLVSHGGLSVNRWVEMDRLDDPLAAAAILNEEFWHDPARALRPGIMLRGETGPPGVAWTEPVRELYQPWIEADTVPFAQVHGHASPWSWARRGWFPGVPRRMKKSIVVNDAARQTMMMINGRAFLGIDTAFGANEVDPITPLILTAP